jgi:hemerythrin-like domain-containing protein
MAALPSKADARVVSSERPLMIQSGYLKARITDMANVALLLRLEHMHFDDLLKFIEQQLDQDGSVDLELLQSIVEYFADYPDQCHHPVEDLVFRKMHSKDSVRAAPVSKILQDHQSIAESTKRFALTLKAAVDDENVRITELRDVMREFVDKYRTHMVAEEKNFFPLAVDLLSDNDWGEIEYVLFDQSDPLFDREAEERFRRLRKKIDMLATTSNKRVVVMREAKILRQLTSIQEFNEMAEKAGHDYRLIEHPEGAYGIEHRGEVILDIPKCSVTRAIWCAYFYVTGRRELGSPV